jgi:hypothetical protein
MKTAARKMTAVLTGLLLVGFIASCASTGSKEPMPAAPAQQKGFLDGFYQNLEPGPEGGAKMRWLKPGVDFSSYDKIMLESVIFYFAEDSESKRIDALELKDLADACNLALVNTLKDSYPIVGQPGPGVLRVRFAITDLKASKPGLSAVSSVLPVGLGISAVKKGASGSWTGSGATSAEVMALDSVSNEVIAVAQDDRSAAFTERFSKWGSAEEAFEFWGERLKNFMAGARGM